MSNNNVDAMIEEFNDESQETALSKRSTGFAMEPANMSEAMKVCKFIANSQLVPSSYRGKPEDIFLAINHGMELGLPPMLSLSSVKVINGIPTVDTKTHLALVRQHPDFEWIREDNDAFEYAIQNSKVWAKKLENIDPDDTSICVVKRKDEPVVIREFSKEDVNRAGLGNVHKTYPKDMRKYRARGRALESAFGDVTKGFGVTEIESENVKVYGDDYENADVVADKVEAQRDEMAEAVSEQLNSGKKKGTDKRSTSNSASKRTSEQEASANTSQKEENEEPAKEELEKDYSLEDYPVHKGGPYWELSNGEQFQGAKNQAEQAEAKVQGKNYEFDSEAQQKEVDKAKEEAIEEVESNEESMPDDFVRTEVSEDITATAKEKFGTSGMAWYKGMKEYWKEINPDADTMMDLTDEELWQLHQKVSHHQS